jgi:hypothetical protein
LTVCDARQGLGGGSCDTASAQIKDAFFAFAHLAQLAYCLHRATLRRGEMQRQHDAERLRARAEGKRPVTAASAPAVSPQQALVRSSLRKRRRQNPAFFPEKDAVLSQDRTGVGGSRGARLSMKLDRSGSRAPGGRPAGRVVGWDGCQTDRQTDR